MEEFLVSDDKEKCAINALFNVSEETLETKVKSLKEWIDQCPQLPLESKDEGFLQIMLLRGKFQEEIVKKNIENYFCYLCRYREFFAGLANIKPLDEVGINILLPRLTPSWERICFFKLDLTKVEMNVDVRRCFAICLATAVIGFNHDYVPKLRIIIDLKGFTISHILQVNINELFKLMGIYENILKIRISGIELINGPHILGTVLNMAKVVLKPKLFSRVFAHQDLSSLHKNVPKQNLPSDYGGELQSTEELLEIWDQIFTKKKSFLAKIEQLSQRNNEDEGIFGVQGSFKTLVVD
jgi:hypothetical protein